MSCCQPHPRGTERNSATDTHGAGMFPHKVTTMVNFGEAVR